MTWQVHVITVLLALIIVVVLLRERRQHRRRLAAKGPPVCRISEEWQGLFIGRRYCSVHDVKWDDGGKCPNEGLPVRYRHPHGRY